jgi:hypothetical protein
MLSVVLYTVVGAFAAIMLVYSAIIVYAVVTAYILIKCKKLGISDTWAEAIASISMTLMAGVLVTGVLIALTL